MRPITILILPLTICLLLIAVLLFKRNKISLQTFLFWELIWIITGVVFVFPDIINVFSRFLGFNNRMLFVFTISILLLLVMAFVNFAKNKQNELMLIKLIQHVSLLASDIEDQKEGLSDADSRHHRRL